MRPDENVASVMSLELLTVPPDTPIGELRKLCKRKKVPCVVVVEQDSPIGILCASDVVGVDDCTPAQQVMKSPVHTIGAACTVQEACNKLDGLGVGVLPVTAGDVLVGLVTRTELQLGHRPAF